MASNHHKTCPFCNNQFTAPRKSMKFCSPKCGQQHKIREKNKNDPDAVECVLCGMRSQSLFRHVKAVHNISGEEYKKTYNAPLCSNTFTKHQSDRVKGDKNPGWQHNGKFSPFSENFVNAASTDRKELMERMAESVKNNGNNSATLLYWTKQGYFPEEAEKLRSERQVTFSLEKCIAKYGVEKGTERWNQRQFKWFKNNKKSNFSQISQKLFWEIFEKLPAKENVYFATLKDGVKDSSGKNNECTLSISSKVIKPDFYVQDKKLLIEFDGDYWHGKVYGAFHRQQIRDRLLLENGYKVLHIKECDYNKDPGSIVQQCLDFINNG